MCAVGVREDRSPLGLPASRPSLPGPAGSHAAGTSVSGCYGRHVPMQKESSSSQIIRFGTFELDVRAGELRKQGVKIKLQEQPFRILEMLLAHPGELVTREELRSRLWLTDTFVDFDHSLNKAINKLREPLDDSSESP